MIHIWVIICSKFDGSDHEELAKSGHWTVKNLLHSGKVVACWLTVQPFGAAVLFEQFVFHKLVFRVKRPTNCFYVGVFIFMLILFLLFLYYSVSAVCFGHVCLSHVCIFCCLAISSYGIACILWLSHDYHWCTIKLHLCLIQQFLFLIYLIIIWLIIIIIVVIIVIIFILICWILPLSFEFVVSCEICLASLVHWIHQEGTRTHSSLKPLYIVKCVSANTCKVEIYCGSRRQ
jgi:hypothetical protein